MCSSIVTSLTQHPLTHIELLLRISKPIERGVTHLLLTCADIFLLLILAGGI